MNESNYCAQTRHQQKIDIMSYPVNSIIFEVWRNQQITSTMTTNKLIFSIKTKALKTDRQATKTACISPKQENQFETILYIVKQKKWKEAEEEKIDQLLRCLQVWLRFFDCSLELIKRCAINFIINSICYQSKWREKTTRTNSIIR